MPHVTKGGVEGMGPTLTCSASIEVTMLIEKDSRGEMSLTMSWWRPGSPE